MDARRRRERRYCSDCGRSVRAVVRQLPAIHLTFEDGFDHGGHQQLSRHSGRRHCQCVRAKRLTRLDDSCSPRPTGAVDPLLSFASTSWVSEIAAKPAGAAMRASFAAF